MLATPPADCLRGLLVGRSLVEFALRYCQVLIELAKPRQIAGGQLHPRRGMTADVVFETGEMLSLNATNVRTLLRAYGSNGDRWIGKQVELVLGRVKFQGEPQEAVIVKPVSSPMAAAEKEKESTKFAKVAA